MLTRSASYPDRETAQWATQQVVTANEQAVHRWLAQGTRARLTIEAAWPSRGEPVGRVQLEATCWSGADPSTSARRAWCCAASRRARTASPSTPPSRSTCRGRPHMSMKPLEHDRRYGELDRVMRAYLGQPADDTPERRSRSPRRVPPAHLAHPPLGRRGGGAPTARVRPQPPGRVRQELGEFYSVPDTGKPQSEIGDWLGVLADHLKRSVEEGTSRSRPPRGRTGSGTRASPRPRNCSAAGSRRTSSTSSPTTRPPSPTTRPRPIRSSRPASWGAPRTARPSPGRGDYALAAAELGMEVNPPAPFSHGAWFRSVAATLSGA